MGRTANSEVLLLCLLLLLLPSAGALPDAGTASGETPATADLPSAYTAHLFIPTARMIHSDQINALISGPGGETIIGTSFGLSTYNGSWSTRHQDLDNVSAGLLSDYVTALEFDAAGNLWIGYAGGLQIFDGRSYRTIRDQQLLKETRIKDLQRWGDDMWIATGHAGIHRYRAGTWTWYQPMAWNGPPFYEVRSMALDTNNNVLVVATETEGLYTIRSSPGNDEVTFTLLAARDSRYGNLLSVRQDPHGGVLLSNASMVVSYTPAKGLLPVLTPGDLGPGVNAINDCAAAPDGRLFLATDNGIFVWKDGRVIDHLGRFEGVGTSPVVRTVAIDAKNRIWFSTPGYVGFLEDRSAAAPPIPVELVTHAPAANIPTAPATPRATIPPVTISPAATRDEPPIIPGDSFFQFLNPVLDPIVRAIRSLGSHR